MNGTKIDWATKTWNPVTGCLHGCPYCYARNMAQRFGGWTLDGVKTTESYTEIGKEFPELDNPRYVRRKSGRELVAPFPFGFTPTLHRYRLSDPAQMKKPQRIFVGSMTDLFGEWVPDAWIKAVLDACQAAPWHTYLFLTKNPGRYLELEEAAKLPMNEHFWYGTTASNAEQMDKAVDVFDSLPVKMKSFLSVEPLMEDITDSYGWLASMVHKHNSPYFSWIIVGAMTGPEKEKHKPRREWVENIVEATAAANAAVFMKENLAEVWGPDLIQDHPAGMLWPEVV